MKRIRETFMKVIMFPVFHLVLKPLIKRNYRKRYEMAKAEGFRAGPDALFVFDEWYWADRLAVRYGYYVK